MDPKNSFDDFDLLLSEFNHMEEPFFLSEIKEFAESSPKIVIKTFTLLLKNKTLNIQLKYLILKSIGTLKFEALIPIIKETLEHEEKIQILTEGINSLVEINTLPAYKVIVNFLLNRKDIDITEKIEQRLKLLFSRNQLAYHFDIFYRDRGNTNGVEKSSEYLIRNLPDAFINDILSGLSSKYSKIRYETLRILKNRPNPIYYSTIYNFFKKNFQKADEQLFLIMVDALSSNAALSIAKQKIYLKLKNHIKQLSGDKKNIFIIILLKLNTSEIISYIPNIYNTLNYDKKILLFDYLKPEDFEYYANFLRKLLPQENNQLIIEKIVEIFVKVKDFDFLFNILEIERGIRKQKLLDMILEHDPDGIDGYIRKYLSPQQENQILYLSLQYILRHVPDLYYESVQKIFFSGVSKNIKTLILRNINRFEPHHQKVLMEAILNKLEMVRDFKKDFLFSLLGVMNARVFQEQMEEKVLNQVLILMEEASEGEIVNFIYFFDNYDIKKRRDCDLIIDEFRLIQNTLLKSSNDQNIIRLIHMLIKNIQRKMTLKKTSTSE